MIPKNHIFLLLFLIEGCAGKDTWLIEPERAVEFRIQTDSSLTKTNSVFGSSNAAIIYAFRANDASSPLGHTPVTANATSYGELIATHPVYLQNGNYDFYSVSVNNSSIPSLIFNNGITNGLANGQDYLWASNEDCYVYSGKIVAFNYRHLACQIKISVLAGSNISSLAINYIKFTFPSTSGRTFNLSTGIISSSGSLSDLSIVPGSGMTRIFLTLPCTIPTQIEVNLNAAIDGEYTFGKSYYANLDYVLSGGYSYDITLTLCTDNTFNITSNISAWQTLSETITY